MQNGDAEIARDQAAGTWTLAAGGTTLTLALDASRDFAVTNFSSASGAAWAIASAPDTTLHVAGQAIPFGSRSAGFAYRAVDVSAFGSKLQLNATFDLAAAGLQVTRHYAIVSGSPTFEAWTTFTPTTSAASVSDINAVELTIPNGAIHWVTGLQGDAADVASESAFTRRARTLAVGQQFSLGAKGRASEQTVPWFAVDGARDEFYAALLWSGAWSATFSRSSSGLVVNVGLASMTTSVREPIEGPHVLVGVVPGGIVDAAAAIRSYALDGIRAGRPLTPLVTYNTWFAYGVEIDEATIESEMERAASLGVELFIVEAGWYPVTGASNSYDFDAGLGSWTADAARFPNGLGPLRDYAHTLGLKFGLWVEPERVNRSLVGEAGVRESWLTTSQGEYGSDETALICLAGSAARDYILGWLTALIDDVAPDYLKWDNNLWVNCDRSGHGHGAADGNFAHVNGLYRLLGALRDRYPDLLIENVSGGGNRLDLGMLRYTDAGWMDDRTAPSAHVRHNIEGLAALFPPAYLLSFVVEHETEPVHGSPDLGLYFRSRMAGALGLCFRTDGFTEGEAAEIAREIAIDKTLRSTLSVAAGALLTPQAAPSDGPPWDVLQATASGGEESILYAYQSDEATGKVTVKPTGLLANATYEVISVDAGSLGTATGAQLMADGIDVLQSPNTAAHILILRINAR